MFFSEVHADTMDLAIDFYGYEECSPHYSFGPAIRENYVLHYISKGKGTFFYKEQEIPLKAGDLFLLKPNEVTFYQADQEEPWAYYWLGLSGNQITDYLSLSSLLEDAYLLQQANRSTASIGQALTTLLQTAEAKERSASNQLELLSLTYQLLFTLHQVAPASLASTPSQAEEICLACRRIIDNHYNMDGLSIARIAEELMVNRSYLTTSFKKHYQISPKDYLLQIRMRRAKQLLESTQEAIKVIAYSVGYRDPLYFSKVFKDYYHQSPSAFRK